MANDLLTNNGIQNLVIGVELLVIGLIGIVIVYYLSKKQPKQTSRNNILYIIMMALIFYALFYLKDPFEFLPPQIWDIVNLAILVGVLGFYHQLVGGVRTEFNDRLDDFRKGINIRIDDFKDEVRRDLDRIEKRLEKIESKLGK